MNLLKNRKEDVAVYISGALAGSRDLASACNVYEEFGELLTIRGLNCYLPHKYTHPLYASALCPEEVFARDLRVLESSSLVVAFLDEPSLGVGAEIALAISRGIPVIGAVRVRGVVSRFVKGLIEGSPSGSCIEYTSLVNLAEHVLEYASGFINDKESEGGGGSRSPSFAVIPSSERTLTAHVPRSDRLVKGS